MNRGSAKKWVELLKQEKRTYDTSQLNFIVAETGEEHISPTGVLAEFLEPSEKTFAWDGVSYVFSGEQFFLSTQMLAKCKIKITNEELETLENSCQSFLEFAELIKSRWIDE